MKFHEIIDFSVEFFPPKSEKGMNSLKGHAEKISEFNPRFFSITCGAGFTGGSNTVETVKALDHLGVESVPHIICRGFTEKELSELIEMYKALGVRKALALRGDRAPNDEKVEYRYASDLVKLLKRTTDWEIFVAGYPEIHPESYDAESDIRHLKYKLENGSQTVITQFFFSPEVIFDYKSRMITAGIDANVIPGILPILNFQSVKEFAAKCHSSIPDWVSEMFADETSERQASAKLLEMQVTDLLTRGIKEFHFYTLNKSEALIELLETDVIECFEKLGKPLPEFIKDITVSPA